MHALKDFLTTDYGLMSLFCIVFIIAMGAYIGWFVNKNVKADTERHERELRQRAGTPA